MPIRITAKRDGFRRAGIAHSKEPIEHADDAFTPQQLKILQAESMLIIEIVDTKEKTPAGANPIAEKAKAIKAAGTLADLDVLAASEENAGLLKAIAKRRGELSPKGA